MLASVREAGRQAEVSLSDEVSAVISMRRILQQLVLQSSTASRGVIVVGKAE